MSMEIITGYSGTAHVTAENDGEKIAGLLHKGKFVTNIGNQFEYSIISNNCVRIKDGVLFNQGRQMGMGYTDYEDVTIDNGLQGVKRADLIVCKYAKNESSGIETGSLSVVKGTSGDSYVDPEIVTGNILQGDTEDDFVLYRVKINGISIESIETVFEVQPPVFESCITDEQIDALF